MTAPDPIRRAAEEVADALYYEDADGRARGRLGGAMTMENVAWLIEKILREQLGRASRG